MSSRQVKAAAYKAAESRPGASGRGSRDASKKSASQPACLDGPPLTINQPTKYTSRQYNQPTNQPSHLFMVKNPMLSFCCIFTGCRQCPQLK